MRLGIPAALAAAVAVGFDVWLQQRPPTPDAGAVHTAIRDRRSGAEVTFVGEVTAEPVRAGSHEQITVRTRIGDVLELDRNTDLGPWVPVRPGDSVTVHGQLYVDPGRAGAHCLHARTSRGCPQAGWIELDGTTYQ